MSSFHLSHYSFTSFCVQLLQWFEVILPPSGQTEITKDAVFLRKLLQLYQKLKHFSKTDVFLIKRCSACPS